MFHLDAGVGKHVEYQPSMADLERCRLTVLCRGHGRRPGIAARFRNRDAGSGQSSFLHDFHRKSKPLYRRRSSQGLGQFIPHAPPQSGYQLEAHTDHDVQQQLGAGHRSIRHLQPGPSGKIQDLHRHQCSQWMSHRFECSVTSSHIRTGSRRARQEPRPPRTPGIAPHSQAPAWE